MKTMILAALAAINLGAGAADARSLSRNAPRQQQNGNSYDFMAGGGG